MADRYDPRVPLRGPAAHSVMPPQPGGQGAAARPADRRLVARQTSVARPAPVEINGRSGGFREHPADALGAVREPSTSSFAPPPRSGSLFRPKSPLPVPEWQGDGLADRVPFGVGVTDERADDEEALAPSEPVLSPHQAAKREHRPRRLGLFIGGVVLAVALAAGVAYVMLQGENPIAAPSILAPAISAARAMPADGEQNLPSNESVDETHTGAIAKVAAAASDDAPASGDHPAAGDADADQVSAGKPPPGASPAVAAVAPAEPGGAPANASGDATPASADDEGAAGNASPASAAAAGGPAPPTKPADKPAVLKARGGAISPTETDAGKPTPDSPVAPSGRVFVQVSAQKSESAARSTYRGLQVKFPSILGKLDPNIQRVDLGDKGVFYRVRVGPFAFADAQKICGNYKADSGSDCLIARH